MKPAPPKDRPKGHVGNSRPQVAPVLLRNTGVADAAVPRRAGRALMTQVRVSVIPLIYVSPLLSACCSQACASALHVGVTHAASTVPDVAVAGWLHAQKQPAVAGSETRATGLLLLATTSYRCCHLPPRVAAVRACQMLPPLTLPAWHGLGGQWIAASRPAAALAVAASTAAG